MVKKILILICFALSPGLLYAQVYQVQSGHAEFTGYTPLFSFEGSSDSLHGTVNLADSTVSFQLPVKSIDTGNSKRDRDMRRTLESEEYPYISFSGNIIDQKLSETVRTDSATVQGSFAAHGVSRQVTIRGLLKTMRDSLKIRASWPLDITDYQIDPPNVLFYSMKERVEVRIEAVLKKRQSDNQ
jgi:polyisoprenoid-binding protein YceI